MYKISYDFTVLAILLINREMSNNTLKSTNKIMTSDLEKLKKILMRKIHES